jgi:Ca-activated chloride channel family protein
MKRLLLVGVLLYAVTLTAQTGSIQGTVADSTGARLPGVQIEIENLNTGQKTKTLSNDNGEFKFINFAQGKVRVTASFPNFKNWVTEVKLGSSTIKLHVILEVGDLMQTIRVDAMRADQLLRSPNSGGDVAESRRSRRVANRGARPMNTESYDFINDNPFVRVAQQPRSTFAADVDTASYANVRRFINNGERPPKDAVRIEELINYFKYAYTAPEGPHPVAIYSEVGPAFWAPSHRLARIAIRARDVDLGSRKAANLVFLIDVSGSMEAEAKLPLVQRSLHLVVDRLREDDRVTMVVYAGNSGLVLPPTSGGRKNEIHSAIDRLEAGGSTNGGEGIELAYNMATANFIEGGINRVILATDGDFNVGVTNEGDLVRLVQKQAKSGVFLTVLGYGIGNYKDSTLEKLADKGHGNYAYIDSFSEAKRVLVEQLSGTLLTVAKDVKLQIEFNPAQVEGYRLIGYENRILADADFDDDNKQGGDIGAGHVVTALFEIVPRGGAVDAPSARPLKYQTESKTNGKGKGSDELLTVSLRYKQPDGKKSALLEVPVKDSGHTFEKASADFRFASSVAAFGMLLRDSPHKGSATFRDVLTRAAETAEGDGNREEFLELARQAERLR